MPRGTARAPCGASLFAEILHAEFLLKAFLC